MFTLSLYVSFNFVGTSELCNFEQKGHSKSEYSIHVTLASLFHFRYVFALILFKTSLSIVKNHLEDLLANGSKLAQISREYCLSANSFK
jgi:hypothetical protein